jgi:hypothetical protein
VAFDLYITKNQIKARSLDLDEGLLRKNFYDITSPLEMADCVSACDLCIPEATLRGISGEKTRRNPKIEFYELS